MLQMLCPQLPSAYRHTHDPYLLIYCSGTLQRQTNRTKLNHAALLELEPAFLQDYDFVDQGESRGACRKGSPGRWQGDIKYIRILFFFYIKNTS